MITDAIDKAMYRAWEKEWDRTYWLIDMHHVVLTPDYSNMSVDYCNEHVVPALKHLSQRDDIILIMWTRSTPDACKYYENLLARDGITFDYINENPEVDNLNHADFSVKIYANVILDDKAGFNPDRDWPLIRKYFEI